jgi:hypothetical protein
MVVFWTDYDLRDKNGRGEGREAPLVAKKHRSFFTPLSGRPKERCAPVLRREPAPRYFVVAPLRPGHCDQGAWC